MTVPTSGPRPLRSGIGITALGAYVPDRVVPNSYFEAHLETTAEWIESRSGIRERRFAAPEQTTSGLGVLAVRDLLAHRPDALDGVDSVICATSSPDAMFPSTAALIAKEVGLAGAAAMDVSVACSGFVYALSVAYGLVAGGVARRVLVVGAEVMSRVVDQHDRNTAILFGDGAGAVVVGAVPDGCGFQSFELGADAAGGPSLFLRGAADRLPGGMPMGPYLTQNGREVFKFAVRMLGDCADAAMRRAGRQGSDIDWLIPHQANVRIIEAAVQRLGLPMTRTVVNLDRYGNTSAASIPLALCEGVRDGRVQHGQQLVLAGFGGGLSWAAAALTWWGGAAEA
ncbi:MULTISPECIES: beta-ketoacyl-ACP synthase III [Deinococcus]|uniref:Beta-ketoacyl-[acyl-carrier-protein] synthase III n=1 Tax=Deinococcus rufus TaxID=2136097 RepID=A0ABV7Z2H7_9DEIO|nr:beta-ketoacyl-ACP synthase III [Deinococcus sp. AB2017081]WQE95280.1 beta-ketoacyl-ACP synthase III [Deinococcus sp. AB2017081]